MQPAEHSANEIQAELTRRHKTAAAIVRTLLVVTVVFSLVAFLARSHLRHQENEALDRALRITILILGLGSVLLRRTRFSETRLQDTVALKGVAGLLGTLAATSLQVALLGAVMTTFGFIATLMTGNEFYSYGTGVVGFVVLLYGYPARSSWEQAVQRFTTPAS